MLGAAIKERLGMGSIDGSIKIVERETLHVFSGINPQAVDTHGLHEPLGISHQHSHGIFNRRITCHRISRVE